MNIYIYNKYKIMYGTSVIYMSFYKTKYECKGYGLYKINEIKGKAYTYQHHIQNVLVLKWVSSKSLRKKVQHALTLQMQSPSTIDYIYIYIYIYIYNIYTLLWKHFSIEVRCFGELCLYENIGTARNWYQGKVNNDSKFKLFALA